MADDDEVSLATLASKPPKTIDDNASLASLVAPRKPAGAPAKPARVSKPGAPAPSPQAGAAPGKGKGKGKRKKPDSGSSSSSSSSSSSDSDDAKPLRKGPMKARASVAKKVKKLAQGGTGDGEEETFDHGGAVKKKERMPKEDVVATLLCRWWYVLPDWPPQEESYYQARLSEQNLKKVHIQEWEWLEDQDKDGKWKVYELSQFRGVFRGAKGELIDLRPKETCPCFKNFMTWDMVKLYGLVVKAYEKQLEDLKNSKYKEVKLEAQLKADLNKYRQKLHDATAVGRR